MKNLITILKPLLFLSIFIPTLLLGQQEFGKITLPLGRVQIQKNGTGAFKKAMPRTSVHEKDIIKTLANSRCEISLAGGGKLRIGQISELEITLANVKPMVKDFGATLKKGDVWVAAKAAFGDCH